MRSDRPRLSTSVASNNASILLFGGVILIVCSLILPWVQSSSGFTYYSLPLLGYQLIEYTVLFSPATVVPLAACVVILVRFVDLRSATLVGSILATLVVFVGIRYYLQPGFVYDGGGYVSGVSIVKPGLGVYAIILGGTLMMTGGYFSDYERL